MHKTEKILSNEDISKELDAVIDIVCDTSNRAVANKERFNSVCEEIGYVVRNQLYKDGIIDIDKQRGQMSFDTNRSK